jgi:NAD(P)-dependent dehydrogenase (short-subunit alcohol dehydrogenase family)
MPILEGKTAVVVGGGNGVGAAIAVALAAAKANVCLIERSRRTLEAVDERARHHGADVTLRQADISDESSLKNLIADLTGDPAPIDILVQNAALDAARSIEESATADFDRHYRINLRAPYVLIQGLLPKLKARAGQIVFLSAGGGISTKAPSSRYDATEQGLKALADSLRNEINPAGIRVTSIHLGQTAPEMPPHAAKTDDGRSGWLPQPSDVALAVVSALRLPRTAEITDFHIRPMAYPAPHGAA